MLTSVCAGCGRSTRSTGASSPSRCRRSARCSSSRSTCSPTRRWSAGSAPRPLGGLALASTVLNTLVWVFNFLSYATTVRVAVRRGRGDLAGGAADALQALWLALGIGLAVAVVIGVTAGWLIELLGDDPAVIDQGVTYLQVSVVGIPFQMVAFACIGYLYGLPDTKRPFLVLLFATTANLLLELLLVFGLDWGIAGSALGHRDRADAQRARVPVHRRPAPAGRRAAPPSGGAVGDVGGRQGRRAHGAAHRLPARDARHGHRGGGPGRHAGAGRPPDRRADLPAARHHRRHVQGVRPVARRPRPRRRSARRGARRRRPPLRLGLSGRDRPDGRDARGVAACCRGSSPTTRRWWTPPQVALVVLALDAAAGRHHLRHRRHPHGRQRLPEPPLVDDHLVRRRRSRSSSP